MSAFVSNWDQIAALAVVGVVAALGIRSWLTKRRAGQSACGSCPTAKPSKSEQTLQFFRRRPD